MNLSLIAQVLQDAGLGTMGTDIFAGFMPAECKRGILLRNPLSGTPVNPYLPNYYRSKLQAIVRATDFEDGDAFAKRVGKVLKMFNREFRDTSGNLLMRVNHIFPEQQPIVYPFTPGNTLEWSLNFVTSYVEPE